MIHCAALLAAGGGTRFAGDEHKLLASLHGRPVWEHALAAVAAARFDHVVVVTGAVPLVLPPGTPRHVTLHPNPRWQSGQAASLAVAVDAAAALGAATLTVGLADQPFVTTAAWDAVASAPGGCRIAIATYEGVPGPNPVRLAADVWPLLPTEGDHGARHLIAAHPAWVCRVPCLGSVADIDTLEDLERWRSC